ncbi:Endonuclease/exonuclease/phosphatase [Endogone sp. FLAS-F59071]|nr:Endonuclease/exonuclease/phosphatase [Endogone sp. FLAS-F59071]|eukprot:RUS19167.1 Endonuclease/exonuclease/phosphatase [Endogone sp. FLAS-F59071]
MERKIRQILLDPLLPSSKAHILRKLSRKHAQKVPEELEGSQESLAHKRPPLSKSEFVLTLISNAQSLRMEVDDINVLQNFVAELRRFMAIAQEEDFHSKGSTHRWVQFYGLPQRRRSVPLRQNSSPVGALGRLRSFSDADDSSMASAASSRTSLTRASSMHFSSFTATDTAATSTNPFLVIDPFAPAIAVENAPWSPTSIDSPRGGPKYNVKEQWIAKQMRDREGEFVQWDHVHCFVGTYNVHGGLPAESLGPWLLSWQNADDADEKKEPDIYVDLRSEAYVIYDPSRGLEWCNAIENGLGDLAGNYIKVVSKQLIGMLTIVYAKQEYIEEITEIGASSAGCGLMGMMGNKGGVAIRFKLRDSYLCFVNSHLAALPTQTQRRNQDYSEICKRITFPVGKGPYNPSGTWLVASAGMADNSPAIAPGSAKALSIFDTDHLIWTGDLNYRIDMPEAEVKTYIEAQHTDTLLEFDQLNIERSAKRTFHDFQEGAITFAPTYKYDEGTSDWDSSEKKRSPAWTDRILWKKPNQLESTEDKEDNSIKLRSYTSCMDMIRVIVKDKQHEVRADVIRQLDKLENEAMPDARISSSSVSLGEVKYLVPEMASVVLENVGQVIAQYKFIPKMKEKSICKPWLWVNPPMGILLPGENVQINFTALVDNVTAPALNSGRDKLEDMLILHLENGKDFFLLVDGSYSPTCFAMDLERLVRMSKPVRAAVAEANGRPDKVELVDEDSQLSVPKELFRVVDFLWLHGLNVDSLFLVSGDQSTIAYIRECLDTGEEFDFPRLVKNYDPSKQVESIIPLPGSAWGKAPKAADVIKKLEESDDDVRLPTPLVPIPIENTSSSEIVRDIVHTDTENYSLSEDPESSSTQDDDHMGIHSMAEVLVRFLEALPEPVIPVQFYQQCLDVGNSREDVHQILNSFPNIHANVFLYLTGFLREVIVKGPKEGSELRREKIAMVFSSIFLRASSNLNERNPETTAQRKQAFLMHFIEAGTGGLTA